MKGQVPSKKRLKGSHQTLGPRGENQLVQKGETRGTSARKRMMEDVGCLGAYEVLPPNLEKRSLSLTLVDTWVAWKS